jgi:hypothetical protein
MLACLLLSPRKFPGAHLDPRATVQLERFGKFKTPTTSSRIEPVPFRLVAKCLSQPRYSLPPDANLFNVSMEEWRNMTKERKDDFK